MHLFKPHNLQLVHHRNTLDFTSNIQASIIHKHCAGVEIPVYFSITTLLSIPLATKIFQCRSQQHADESNVQNVQFCPQYYQY